MDAIGAARILANFFTRNVANGSRPDDFDLEEDIKVYTSSTETSSKADIDETRGSASGVKSVGVVVSGSTKKVLDLRHKEFSEVFKQHRKRLMFRK